MTASLLKQLISPPPKNFFFICIDNRLHYLCIIYSINANCPTRCHQFDAADSIPGNWLGLGLGLVNSNLKVKLLKVGLASSWPGIELCWHRVRLASSWPGIEFGWHRVGLASSCAGIEFGCHRVGLASSSAGIELAWH